MRVLIGIGATAAQLAPAKLLERSLTENADGLEIVVSIICNEPEWEIISNNSELSIGTVFSLQRFLVSEIARRNSCDVAIYLDSDIICLRPFSDLVQQYVKNNQLICLARPNPNFHQHIQSAVMLTGATERHVFFFRSLLSKYLNSEVSYKELHEKLYQNEEVLLVNHKYNSRDYFDTETVFLHFTDLWTQPWVSPYRKEGSVWLKNHYRYMSDSESYKELVEYGVEKKYYRRGLLRSVSVFSDLFFLPPQLNVYRRRHLFFRLVPKPVLGFLVQLIAWIRSVLNIRTT